MDPGPEQLPSSARRGEADRRSGRPVRRGEAIPSDEFRGRLGGAAGAASDGRFAGAGLPGIVAQKRHKSRDLGLFCGSRLNNGFISYCIN